MYGISSSRNDAISRISRLLAWPFSPRNSMSCWARMAMLSSGMHGVVVADDAGIQLLAGLQLGEEVVVDFLLDGFGCPAAVAEFGQRGGFARY